MPVSFVPRSQYAMVTQAMTVIVTKDSSKVLASSSVYPLWLFLWTVLRFLACLRLPIFTWQLSLDDGCDTRWRCRLLPAWMPVPRTMALKSTPVHHEEKQLSVPVAPSGAVPRGPPV